MEANTDTLATTHPGLLGAVLIALACGWIARRILLRGPGVFESLALGLGGALVGLAASGAVGRPISGAAGLAAVTLGGAVLLLSLWVLIARR